MLLTPFCVTSFYEPVQMLPAFVQVTRVTAGARYVGQRDFHMCVSDGVYYTTVYAMGDPQEHLVGAVLRIDGLKKQSFEVGDETHIHLFATFQRVSDPVPLRGSPEMWGFTKPALVWPKSLWETRLSTAPDELSWKISLLNSLVGLECALSGVLALQGDTEANVRAAEEGLGSVKEKKCKKT